jgi:hypothetical protein
MGPNKAMLSRRENGPPTKVFAPFSPRVSIGLIQIKTGIRIFFAVTNQLLTAWL